MNRPQHSRRKKLDLLGLDERIELRLLLDGKTPVSGTSSVPERSREVLDDGGRETVEEVSLVDTIFFPELRDFVSDFRARGDGGDGFVPDDAGVDPRLSMATVPVERLFGPREDVAFERFSRGVAEQPGVFMELDQ